MGYRKPIAQCNISIINIIIIILQRIYATRQPGKFLNDVFLEEDEKEELEIRGCRKLEQE